METVATLNQKVADLSVVVDEKHTEVEASLKELKDKVDAGSVATQADLDTLGAGLDTVTAKVREVGKPKA